MTRVNTNKALVLIGSLTVLTGLFLLVEYESHFAIVVHQIASLSLVGFCIYHIKLNWVPLLKSLKSDKTMYFIAAILVVSAIIMAVTGTSEL